MWPAPFFPQPRTWTPNSRPWPPGRLGWYDVALLCNHELDVPGSLRRCIRILLHWNTDKSSSEIVHVYIKDAAHLRPDRTQLPPVDWDELEGWIQQRLADVKARK